MAKKPQKPSLNALPPSPSPFAVPSPVDELQYAMHHAVEKAVLAHPKTQKLRDVIKQRMMKAAGTNASPDLWPPPQQSAGKATKTKKKAAY